MNRRFLLNINLFARGKVKQLFENKSLHEKASQHRRNIQTLNRPYTLQISYLFLI